MNKGYIHTRGRTSYILVICYHSAVCLVAQSCPTLCDPMDCNLPGSSVHAISRQEYWSGLPFPPPGDLPNPGIEPRSPTVQGECGRSEPPGKSKNTGSGQPIASPGDLPNLRIESGSCGLQADSLPAELPEKPKTYLEIFWRKMFSYSLGANEAIQLNCAMNTADRCRFPGQNLSQANSSHSSPSGPGPQPHSASHGHHWVHLLFAVSEREGSLELPVAHLQPVQERGHRDHGTESGCMVYPSMGDTGTAPDEAQSGWPAGNQAWRNSWACSRTCCSWCPSACSSWSGTWSGVPRPLNWCWSCSWTGGQRSPRRRWHSGSWGRSLPPGPGSAAALASAGLSQKMTVNFHTGLGDSRHTLFVEVLKSNFHFILVNYFIFLLVSG